METTRHHYGGFAVPGNNLLCEVLMSTSSAVAVSTTPDFRTALRERLMTAFLDLIPQAELDSMIETEIKAFFETPQLLTVEPTKIEFKNPQYDPARVGAWNNDKTLKRDALAFGSRMTPFRQLVWTALHQHLMPIVTAQLADSKNAVNNELSKWLIEKGMPQVEGGVQSMLTSLAIGMSASMFNRAISEALTTAHYNMTTAMQSVGINTSALPQPLTTPPRQM